MAFRIEEGEPPVVGLRRAVVEQIARAEERLGEGFAEDAAKAVHEARKAVKRGRSGLRLGREAFGTKAVRAEIGALRDAAARLSSARDAEVARAVLRELAAQGVGRLPEMAWRHFATALKERGPGSGADLTGEAEVARAELAAARARIAAWPLERPERLAPVLAGLARSQERGAAALKAARKGADPEARHALRKRAKDAWYQFELLSGLWPAVVTAQAEEAHRLSTLLGDEHDGMVLAQMLGEIEGVPDDPVPVLALIAGRREALWAQALPLARRLYAEKPEALVARLATYGAVSRSGSTSSSAGTGSPTTFV